MTDDKPGSNASGRPPAGRSRPRREPVTLDQKPLSVTVEPAPGAPAAGGEADTVPDAPPTAADAAPETAPEAASDTPSEAAPESVAEAAVAEAAAPAESFSAAESPVDALDAPSSAPADGAPAIADAGADAPRVPPEAEASPATASPEIVEEERIDPPPARQGLAGGLVVALLAGGIAGAAVSAGLPFLLQRDGVDAGRVAALEQSLADAANRTEVQVAARAAEEAGSLNAAVATRVTALEERLAQLAERLAAAPDVPAAPDAPDAGALDELRAEIGRIGEALTASREAITGAGERITDVAGRIDGVEATVAALDPVRVREILDERAGLNERLAGLETAVTERAGEIARAGADVARLAAAADTQAGEVARLATRVTTAEGAVAETERRALAAQAASSERVVIVARLAVLERIGVALARGQAFTTEYETLARLGVDAASLAPLAGASGGLAVPASLAVPFANSAAAFAAEELPADAGIVDRLTASAARIVRIRPVDGVPDASDVAGQVEAFLRRNDAAASLAAWRRLPEAARAQTGALADTLQKRIDAEAAHAALTQAQVGALEALPAAAPAQGG